MEQSPNLLPLLSQLTQQQFVFITQLLQLLSRSQLNTLHILYLIMKLIQTPLPKNLYLELNNLVAYLHSSNQQIQLPLINLLKSLTEYQLSQLFEISQSLKLQQPPLNLLRVLHISSQLQQNLPQQLQEELEELLKHLQISQLQTLLNLHNKLQIQNGYVPFENNTDKLFDFDINCVSYDDDNIRPRKKLKSL